MNEKSQVLDALQKQGGAEQKPLISPEHRFPSAPEKQPEVQVQEEKTREVSALPFQGRDARDLSAVEFQLASLKEGDVVHYITPNDWAVNSRGQRRAALVAFVYRSASGVPTGLCNLILFLNGPADTGDMGGPRTRCISFEAGVKFSESGEQGCWTWAK